MECLYLGVLTYILTLYTALPKQSTGQRSRSFVFRCVLDSNFSLFFWSSKRIQTYSANSMSRGWSWYISLLLVVKNLTSPNRIVIVLPGVGTLVNSHDLMAKKDAPIMRSAAWSSLLFLISQAVKLAIQRNRFGVIAFWDFVLGKLLHMPASCSLMLEVSPLSLLFFLLKGTLFVTVPHRREQSADDFFESVSACRFATFSNNLFLDRKIGFPVNFKEGA